MVRTNVMLKSFKKIARLTEFSQLVNPMVQLDQPRVSIDLQHHSKTHHRDQLGMSTI